MARNATRPRREYRQEAVSGPVSPSGVPVRPPGFIGWIAQETGRYSMFTQSLSRTLAPAGSGTNVSIGTDIAQACNMLAEMTLENPAWEWLWILGDDHAWGPNLLNQLLDRRVDVVTPLCLTKSAPFEPVVYTHSLTPDGKAHERIRLSDYPDGGLVEIHSGGSAGMLVRRHILEALEPPWFQSIPEGGQWLAEDIYFCQQVQAAGFKIHVDLDHPIGHIASPTVFPVRSTEGWTFGFSWPDGFQFRMPVGSWTDER